jgi:hypothetical protein
MGVYDLSRWLVVAVPFLEGRLGKPAAEMSPVEWCVAFPRLLGAWRDEEDYPRLKELVLDGTDRRHP